MHKLSRRNKLQKVIIIGASSGIGKELAIIYASHGYMVGISGRRQESLVEIQKLFPDNICIQSFDVTGNENIHHLQSLIAKIDGLDILIYNSGFGKTLDELDWEIENETTKVNVNGFIEIIGFGFNYFLNQGYGQLAATSSIASIKGSSRAPAYAASKAFISNYLEGLFLKAKKSNKQITVTDIQPGFVDTALIKGSRNFWMASPVKAAQQIFRAVKNKKKRVYITKRWRFIALLLKMLPDFIYNLFG